MFVELCKNNGTDYLRLVSSKRITDAKGRKVSRKKTELNIGPLARFDDGKPDYVQRLKESFKNGTPLIDSLCPFVSTQKETVKHSISFADGSADCIAHPKLASHLLLDRIFQELGLDSLCATLKHSLHLEFDLQGYLRLLLFGRILNPASKMATTAQNTLYAESLVEEAYPYHVYDVLDILYAHKEKFIQRMNSSITHSIGRNTSRVYYDVTNFFFEIGEADEDEEIDGEMVKGLRQKGVSKENRREPIVQMGLFLDDNGIPITVEAFPGNTLDQATLRPALKKSFSGLDVPRYILVADRGLCSYKNICYLLKDQQGYIVSKSIRKTKADERAWILDTEGYISQGEGFRYKARRITRSVIDEEHRKQEFTEQVVVYWSKKFYDREYHEHKRFLDFIQKLKENPSAFRVTATQTRNLKRFFKKDVVDKETGEILDSRKLLAMLDEEKLEEFTASMGYYQIVTSETEMHPLDVIEAYHGLTRIEDQFRVMKGTLETRPLYVRTREHIKAHLLLCMMALTMLRIVQKQIVDSQRIKKSKSRYWSYGLSGSRVQEALTRWKVEMLPGDLYRFCDTDENDVALVLAAFGIHIEPRLYTRGELRKLKSSIKALV